MPELEDLSLRMARAAGVHVVDADLEPLKMLVAEHHYDLGDVDDQTKFLAVYRHDRDAETPTRRIHCEDFAQILGVQPEDKYTQDYLMVAAVLMDTPSLGEAAVHELLRRILVNDLMGNPDMHLKNIGLRYTDPQAPELPPAYDIVAYAAYPIGAKGRALRLLPPAGAGDQNNVDPKAPLNPVVVRDFCARLGLPEKPAWTALRRCANEALATWPTLISQSRLTDKMKERLIARLEAYGPKKKAKLA